DLFVADFSTTDLAARAASEIVLMSGVQQYFTYLVGSLCGIPEITLEGTPEDWAKIRQRAEVLREFDLGWSADALAPVLAAIEATASGEGRQELWQAFDKLESASGGERITGWLNVLFPYLGSGKPHQNPWFAWRSQAPLPPEDDEDDEDDEPRAVQVDDLA